MEYNIEVINSLDLIDRVFNKYSELMNDELAKDNPDITRYETLVECSQILVDESKIMLDEATNKTLAGSKS